MRYCTMFSMYFVDKNFGVSNFLLIDFKYKRTN